MFLSSANLFHARNRKRPFRAPEDRASPYVSRNVKAVLKEVYSSQLSS